MTGLPLRCSGASNSCEVETEGVCPSSLVQYRRRIMTNSATATTIKAFLLKPIVNETGGRVQARSQTDWGGVGLRTRLDC